MPTSQPVSLREMLVKMGFVRFETLYDDTPPRWVQWTCADCGERLFCWLKGPDECPSCGYDEVQDA